MRRDSKVPRNGTMLNIAILTIVDLVICGERMG